VRNNSGAGFGPEGIDCKNGVRGGRIHGNSVHDMVNGQDNSGVNGIYVDGYSRSCSDIEIYNNVVYNIQYWGIVVQAEVSGGSVSNIRVYNNLVYGCGKDGIGVSSVYPASDIGIYNNTIVGNGGGRDIFGNGYYGGGIWVANPAVSNVSIRNNIFSGNVDYQVYIRADAASQISISRNVIFGPNDASYSEGGFLYFVTSNGTNPVLADPLFADAASRNYRLQPTSPARDVSGLTGVPGFDLDGILRPQGPAFDIGAYEFR
jgi:hypothetical protein